MIDQDDDGVREGLRELFSRLEALDVKALIRAREGAYLPRFDAELVLGVLVELVKLFGLFIVYPFKRLFGGLDAGVGRVDDVGDRLGGLSYIVLGNVEIEKFYLVVGNKNIDSTLSNLRSGCSSIRDGIDIFEYVFGGLCVFDRFNESSTPRNLDGLGIRRFGIKRLRHEVIRLGTIEVWEHQARERRTGGHQIVWPSN